MRTDKELLEKLKQRSDRSTSKKFVIDNKEEAVVEIKSEYTWPTSILTSVLNYTDSDIKEICPSEQVNLRLLWNRYEIPKERIKKFEQKSQRNNDIKSFSIQYAYGPDVEIPITIQSTASLTSNILNLMQSDEIRITQIMPTEQLSIRFQVELNDEEEAKSISDTCL